jgi:biopolymer transport protein ExbD
MMLIRREDESEDIALQMAPLIDIVFLLLIFFLVTASLKKPHKEIPVEFAHAGGANTAKALKNEVIITIDRQGNFYLGAQGKVSTQQVLKKLNQVALRDPTTRIRIDCDKRAEFQRVVQIINACRVQQLKNLAIRTKT